ncbi:hypothetical protein [Flavobacterium sp. XS2P14]|uniref:hypothetical protein n=1 Tax=Flavobacterium sp. XS2P14 TaxID=3401735 RepID=UPI003AAF7B34
MKNIFKIKNLAFAITLIFVHSYDISAQTYPLSSNTSAYTDYDNYLINKDKSTNTARLSLFTNSFANGTSNIDNNNRDFNINLSNGAWNDPGQKLLTIIQNPNSGDLFQGVVRGNVGIGNNDPKSKLHVNGSFRIEDKFSMSSNGNFDIDSDGVWGGRVRVLPNGNFGIGVLNPVRKLEVDGSSVLGNAIIYRSISGGFGIVHKDLDDSNSAKNYTLVGAIDGLHTRLNKKDTGTGHIGFCVGGVDKAVILNNGNMGIGTVTPSSKLAVNGTVTALNYAVTAAMAADYVFESDYKLKTLSETEAYIKTNKHLPAFKSAKHYEANGYTMIEMNIALEQTVEELTLHAIAQEKEISSMKNELAEIKTLLLAKKK